MTEFSETYFCKTLEATASLATQVALIVGPGDCILLDGEIGSGKTAFARSLIQARLGRVEDVPSPTFTLVQTYPHENGDLWHFDLYRLGTPDEVLELGIEEALDSAICLIEWPDRLGSLIPKNAIAMQFKAHENGHEIIAHWPERFSGKTPHG